MDLDIVLIKRFDKSDIYQRTAGESLRDYANIQAAMFI